ncbi:MAG: sensor histidine kinase [Candidatus Heimdallarchaeaceae archaeon]
MKRYVVGLLFTFPIIVVLPMFFSHPTIYNDYFRYMIAIVLLANTIICIVFATRSKELDEKIFFILLVISLFFYLVDSIFDIISLFADYPIEIYDVISDLVGNIPILILLIYRIVMDFRYIKKESRLVLSVGSLVSSSGFILLGIIAVRVAFSTEIPESDIFLYLPFLIVNILIMVLLVTLYILYVEINFRYYILALLSGYFFVFVGDVYELLYGLYGGTYYRIVARSATLFAFTFLMVVLIWVKGRNLSISSLSQIESERKRYMELYLDLDDKLRDLLVLTQFLRHDFGNDIVVISNALEIYKEKPSTDLMMMAEKRLKIMEERISKLRTREEIYSSFKTQAIPITFIEDITKLFKNISVRIRNRRISIRGNQLLNSVIFNIIDNSFKHGGENVDVQIDVDTKDMCVIIKIKDNGVGMTDQQKSTIKNRVATLDENLEIPDSVGLTLAKTTINGLGGELIIEDNKPRGTIITLELPIFEEK